MIGGNTVAAFQVRHSTPNEIGEGVKTWETVTTCRGFLDLLGGSNEFAPLESKTQDSTHVFIMDYQELDAEISARDTRLVIDGKSYEVTLVDDPMGMHRQLEILLRYIGEG